MPEQIPIRFSLPMNRREAAPMEAPYALKNARLEPYGAVRALRMPQGPFMPSDPSVPTGPKPWILWNLPNNPTYSKKNLDRRTGAVGSEVYGMEDYASFNGRVYITKRQHGEPSIRVLPEDFDGTNILTEAPLVTKVTAQASKDLSGAGYTFIGNGVSDDATDSILLANHGLIDGRKIKLVDSEGSESIVYVVGTLGNYFQISSSPGGAVIPIGGPTTYAVYAANEYGATPSTETGIRAYKWVSYLVIPYSATNEAGPRCYYSYYADGSTIGGMMLQVALEAHVNDATSYIEVYRTREYDDSMTNEFPDFTYYWLGRFANSGGVCPFTDANKWEMMDWFEVHENEEVNPPSKILDTDLSVHAAQYRYVQTGSGGRYFQEVVIASDVDGSAWDYRSPGANCVHIHNGVAIYGGIEWPMKAPAVSFLKTGTGGKTIKVQYEYKTSTDSVSYGTPVEYQNVQKMIVENEGSAALIIYYLDGALWRKWDRLVPNDLGRYICGRSAHPFTFDYQAPPSEVSGSFNPVETGDGFVYEKDVALMSDVNRPWQLSFSHQFSVPDSSEIKAITSARIAEEESMLSYDFYVFTDKSVWIGESIMVDGRPTVRLHPLSGQLGVKSVYYSELLADYTPYYRPVYELTKDGVAFLGTDGRIYYLSGRYPVQTLDDDVPNIWWGTLTPRTIWDLGYNLDQNELWVLTNGGTWVYSFNSKGWVAQRDLAWPYIRAIGQQQHTRAMFGLVHQEANKYYPMRLDEEIYAAYVSDASVTTQPIAQYGVPTKLELISDYDERTEVFYYTATAGANTFTSSIEADPAWVGCRIRLALASGSLPLTSGYLSTLVTGVDGTTVTVADTIPESGTQRPAIVLLRATLEHTVESNPRAETGTLSPRKNAFLRMRGTGHSLKVSGFQEFRSFLVELKR